MINGKNILTIAYNRRPQIFSLGRIIYPQHRVKHITDGNGRVIPVINIGKIKPKNNFPLFS